MSRQSEQLYDAITDIGDDLIESALRPPHRQKRRFRRYAALAAVCALAIGLWLVWRQYASGKTGFADGAAASYRLVDVVYPDNVLYPSESDPAYLLYKKGYSNALHAWSQKLQERREQAHVYQGALEPFLRASTPELLQGEEQDNLLYAPLNVYMALAMLAETTDGDSRAQILDLLGVDSLETLRRQVEALWLVHYQDDGVSTCVLANSMWLDNGIQPNLETIARLAQSYYAASYQGEMGSDAFNRAIRSWLHVQTHGLLDAQAETITLRKNTAVALASTVYFHAAWHTRFQASQNKTDVFHAPGGDTTATYMYRESDQNYYWGEHFSAISLGLSTGGVGNRMWFLLPDEGYTPQDLLSDPEVLSFLSSTPTSDANAWKQNKYMTVYLSLPKFDCLSQTNLTSSLQALGVSDLFDPARADFSALVPDPSATVYLSQCTHAVRIIVDENGVEAAAFTVITGDATDMPPGDSIDFVLDRPFICALSGPDGLPICIGVVNHP